MVGDIVLGEAVGDCVGEREGECVGECVGELVGERVGERVGEAEVGEALLGLPVGPSVVVVGLCDGARVGLAEVGLAVGQQLTSTPVVWGQHN